MTVLTRDLSGDQVRKAYSRWAGVYDQLCGPIFRPAHLAAAGAANDIGTEILEIGVGTGLILPLYGRSTRVTGVDLSSQMLERARQRVTGQGLAHVVRLEQGDIHTLAHPTGSYDAIVMPFVLTLVQSPETALDNCLRMVRGGGEIIIVSHFQSRTGWIAAIERRLAPLIAGFGLRPDFPVARIERWCEASGAQMVADDPVGLFGVYRRIRIRKP